jgi:hypothetical protein
MARTTEEIRTERQKLLNEIQKMQADLEKTIEEGPVAKIRGLMEECTKLGHPNIAHDFGERVRKVCPDCGHWEYVY